MDLAHWDLRLEGPFDMSGMDNDLSDLGWDMMHVALAACVAEFLQDKTVARLGLPVRNNSPIKAILVAGSVVAARWLEDTNVSHKRAGSAYLDVLKEARDSFFDLVLAGVKSDRITVLSLKSAYSERYYLIKGKTELSRTIAWIGQQHGTCAPCFRDEVLAEFRKAMAAVAPAAHPAAQPASAVVDLFSFDRPKRA